MNANQPSVTKIMCYSLKGFPGEPLEQTTLHTDLGIEHDRRFAIENGTQARLEHNDWADCKNFMRLTVNPDLVFYHHYYDHKNRVLSLTNQHNITKKVNIDDSSDRLKFDNFLQEEFGEDKKRTLRLIENTKTSSAYWDFNDAPISIINTQSVAAISGYSQTPLNTERFRGNIEIDGIAAWEELSWVGRTIDIGSATLLITAPIKRCAATSVNTHTGEKDSLVPHLLQSHFGHQYCGVYAKVISGGKIRLGDKMVKPSPLYPLTVTETKNESQDVISLLLTHPQNYALPPFVPGQYITVNMPNNEDKTIERHYTLSNTANLPQNQYRISIKKKHSVSQWLHSLSHGSQLTIKSPRGQFWLKNNARIPVFIGSGIGITPLLSMLKQIAKYNPSKKVWLFYGVRNLKKLTFKEELLDIAKHAPHVKIHLFLSRQKIREPEDNIHYHFGRLTINKIRTLLTLDAYEFYICGPTAMMRNISEGLLRLGVDREYMHMEKFDTREEPSATQIFPKQATINFNKSQSNAVWKDPSQTLLDFAEHLGIIAPYDCRSGTCGACKCNIKGRVHYAMEPVFTLKENEALLCCARPLENLSIEL